MSTPAIANGASRTTPTASQRARLNKLVGVGLGTSSSSVTPSGVEGEAVATERPSEVATLVGV